MLIAEILGSYYRGRTFQRKEKPAHLTFILCLKGFKRFRLPNKPLFDKNPKAGTQQSDNRINGTFLIFKISVDAIVSEMKNFFQLVTIRIHSTMKIPFGKRMFREINFTQAINLK